jgi:hypothetical protein
MDQGHPWKESRLSILRFLNLGIIKSSDLELALFVLLNTSSISTILMA